MIWISHSEEDRDGSGENTPSGIILTGRGAFNFKNVGGMNSDRIFMGIGFFDQFGFIQFGRMWKVADSDLVNANILWSDFFLPSFQHGGIVVWSLFIGQGKSTISLGQVEFIPSFPLCPRVRMLSIFFAIGKVFYASIKEKQEKWGNGCMQGKKYFFPWSRQMIWILFRFVIQLTIGLLSAILRLSPPFCILQHHFWVHRRVMAVSKR